MKDYNVEIDTTLFVNVSKEKFIGYASNQPREFEAGESKHLPIWVAQVIAKQLVDYVLQHDFGVKDTLKDTEQRRSLFAQILPEMAEEREIKPLSKEDFETKIQKQLDEQNRMIAELAGKKESDKDKEIEESKQQLKELADKLEPKKVVKK